MLWQLKDHVTLPYVQVETECLIACNIHRADILVYMQPHKKSCDILVTPKDPTDKIYQAEVVYEVQCESCDFG